MVSKTLFALAAAAHTAFGHFGVTFPAWRADTLAQEDKYSQWTYPCAGVPYGKGNVTDWPLDGGALKLELHHPWTYVFVNLAIGGNSSNFNVSLTPEFWNATGKGTLCVDKVPIPVKVEDGTLASLQVVTVGESGNSLYNCADIRLKKEAKGPENCTAGNIKVAAVKEQSGDGASSSGGNSTSCNSTAGSDKKASAAGTVGVNAVALGTIAGLASAFALGVGF